MLLEMTTRRELLVPSDNPDDRLDFLVTLYAQSQIQWEGKDLDIRITYVPDKLIIVPTSFEAYLDALTPLKWENVEQLAVTILEDFGNELVPRWYQVLMNSSGNSTSGKLAHRILLEDKQPNWANDMLLARVNSG